MTYNVNKKEEEKEYGIILQDLIFLQGDIYEPTRYRDMESAPLNYWAWFALSRKHCTHFEKNLDLIKKWQQRLKQENNLSDNDLTHKGRFKNRSFCTGIEAYERCEYKQKENSSLTKEDVYGFYKELDYVITTGSKYDIQLLCRDKSLNSKGDKDEGRQKITNGCHVDLIGSPKFVRDADTGFKIYLQAIRYRKKGEHSFRANLGSERLINDLDDLPAIEDEEGYGEVV